MGGFKCFITPTSFFPIQEIISRIKISYGNNLAYAVIYLKRVKSLKKLDLTISGYILLGTHFRGDHDIRPGTAKLGLHFKPNNDLNSDSVDSLAISNKPLVVGKIMTPKDVQVPISGICQYVKFTGQNLFCRYDKICVLKM